jgi:hypothetical protein
MSEGVRCWYPDPQAESRCSRRDTRMLWMPVRHKPAPAGEQVTSLPVTFLCPEHDFQSQEGLKQGGQAPFSAFGAL